jgi:hypothetical protein
MQGVLESKLTFRETGRSRIIRKFTWTEKNSQKAKEKTAGK